MIYFLIEIGTFNSLKNIMKKKKEEVPNEKKYENFTNFYTKPSTNIHFISQESQKSCWFQKHNFICFLTRYIMKNVRC